MLKYFSLAFLLVATPVFAGPVKVLGPGVMSCKDALGAAWWIEDKPITPLAAYILGFASASVNDDIPELLPPGETNKDLVLLVHKQCQKDPSDNLFHVLGKTIDGLKAAQLQNGSKGPPESKTKKTEEEYGKRLLKPGEERF